MHVSIHGKGVRTHVKEFPTSTNHVQQPNLAIHNEIIRSGGKGHKKTHAMDPSMEYHSIYLPNFDIHITLFLNDVFSYSPMSKSSNTTLEVTDDI